MIVFWISPSILVLIGAASVSLAAMAILAFS
jgi:hypothetical protein